MEKLELTLNPALTNLAKALRTGQKGLFDPTKSTKLYSDVYNCTVKSGKKDPREIQSFITRWCRKDLTDNVVGTLKQIPTGEEGDTRLFSAVADEYSSFRQVVKTLRFLFSHADQSVATKIQVDPKNAGSASSTGSSHHLQPLSLSEQSALKAFYDTVFRPVEGRLRNSIFDQLDKIRDGQVNVDQSAIRNATSLFEKIAKVLCVTSFDRESVYMSSFARPYFERVESRVAKDYHEYGKTEGFVQFLLARRDLEGQLGKLCLNAVTAPQAVEVFDRVAIGKRYEEILEDPRYGLEAYLDQEKFNSQAVANLFKLFYKMSPTNPKILSAFAQTWGASVLKDLELLKKQWSELTNIEGIAALAVRVMDDILALYKRKVLVVKHEFNGNMSLDRQRHTSLVQALNPIEGKLIKVPGMTKKGASTPSFTFPQLLATFVDKTLRDLASKTSSHSSSHAADDSVWADPISHLFAIVSDKDMFADYYRLHMSKRLLRPHNEDNERAVLSRLQRQNGKVYTHKFEGMINDILNAGTLQQQFTLAYPAASMTDSGACEFNPQVLTAAYWPSVKRDDNFVIPKSLAACQDIFIRFYHKRNPTRQLRWQAERGTAVLQVAFPKAVKEITCSIHQAAVMISIDENAANSNSNNSNNNASSITLGQVSQRTGLSISEVKPLVASMLFAKNLEIVRRIEHGRDVKLAEDHLVEMNPTFSLRVRKLTLPTPISGRGAEDVSISDKEIDAGRCQMLDAAIVRIMKSRRELRMQEIIDLTMNQVVRFFIAQPRAIKHRIEELIQKEFLERDQNENDLFRYLA